jgi:hypothetical protein
MTTWNVSEELTLDSSFVLAAQIDGNIKNNESHVR